jgi:hypothetical protein
MASNSGYSKTSLDAAIPTTGPISKEEMRRREAKWQRIEGDDTPA